MAFFAGKKRFFRIFAFSLSLIALSALSSCATIKSVFNPEKKQAIASSGEIKWPQILKDMRRFDIIFFGAYPFAWFIAQTGYDVHRASSHDWSSDYMPWPLKSATPVEMTQDEYKDVIAMALSLSAGIALADFVIIQVKRAMVTAKEKRYSGGEPIIIRTPFDEEPPPETEGP